MPSSLFGPRPQSQQPQLTQNPVQNNNTFNPPANLSQIKGVMNLLQSGGNVNGVIQTMLRNNPQADMIMSYLNKHNGDAKAAFYDMAQQKGIDPNQILSMLK